MENNRLYHIDSVCVATGEKTRMTSYATSHEKCMVMIGKMTSHEFRRLELCEETQAQHNTQISESMALFACDKFSDDSEKMDVTRVGKSYFKVTRKNAAAVAARIKSAHRTYPAGAYKRAGGGREYPAFFVGMTTKEYIIKFQALNNSVGAHVLPIDFDAIGDRPAALYENGALDFDAIEEANEDYFTEAATHDVAEVVAQAVAAVAIAEAMAPAEDSRELVTCEAGEHEAQAVSMGAAVPAWIRANDAGRAVSSGGFKAPNAPTPPVAEFLGDAAPTPMEFLPIRYEIAYAYPSSDHAKKCGFAESGCFIVSIKNEVTGFATYSEAESFAKESGLEPGRWSIDHPDNAHFVTRSEVPAPIVPTPPLTPYDKDGKCHNAQAGTYGHECGKPAQWIGTTSTGFKSGFCSECKAHGHEARTVASWAPVAPSTPPMEKQADTRPVESADDKRKQWQGFAGDIPASLAISAYSGVSMSPERRGASAQNEYGQTMASDYEAMHAQAVKGGTLDLLPEVFARYRARQASAYRAYLASSSRCVSSFIAGPSNFPAARMNKRAEIAHRRLTEYLDGGEVAFNKACRTLRPDLRPIMAGDTDAVDRLTVEISNAERLQNQMKAANKAIRTNAKAGEAHQVAALMEIGYSEAQAVEILHPPKHYGRGIGFPSYRLTNNGANIRRMRERLEQISKAQATEVQSVECANGVTLEDDAPANRIRLYFPGKPSEEIRAELKSSGFRWAPSVGAWQAYRNSRTLETGRRMAGEPVTDGTPAEPEAAAPVEIEAMAPAMESTDAPAPTVAGFLPEVPAACDERTQVLLAKIKTGEAFQFSKTGPVFIKCRGGYRPGCGGELMKSNPDWLVFFHDPASGLTDQEHRDAGIRTHAEVAPTTPAAEIQPVADTPAVETEGQAAPAVEAPSVAQTLRGEFFAAGQVNRIESKSGKWTAWNATASDGALMLGFSRHGQTVEVSTYPTPRERMAALQAMAREVDKPDDTPSDGQPCHTDATPSSPTTPVAVSTPCTPSAVSSAPIHPRNFVPTDGVHIVDDAFEAWTFPHKDRFGFVMYLGKSAKPWKYYGYPTEAKRDDGFQRHATGARAIAAEKAKRKADERAKLDAGHGLQIGDVVRSSWGYDQTNIDHYQIVKVIGKRTVEVRKLAEHIEATGDMSGNASPIWGEFVGEVMRRTVDSRGNVNMLSASYGRASKIEPLTVVHGVRCYAASSYSSYA